MNIAGFSHFPEFYEDGNYGYNGREVNQGYHYAGPPPQLRGGGRGGRGRGMVSYPPIRSSHADRGGGRSNHTIRMRGLPFSAKEKDLMDFFLPQVPTSVHIEFDDYGRPSGEGEVSFATHQDAESGMSKNNQHMGETVCAKKTVRNDLGNHGGLYLRSKRFCGLLYP